MVYNGPVWPLDQVRTNIPGIDHGDILPALFVVVDSLARGIHGGKAHDDHMDVGLAASFALPGEGAVAEVNLDAVTLEQVVPEHSDLLALGDGVGGDETNHDGGWP